MNQTLPPAPSRRVSVNATPMHQGGGELNASTVAEWLPCYFHIKTICLVAVLVFTAAVDAQDGSVTDNDVIRVAERMYCPVCENIPLDDCETSACVEWKAEIRAQLARGRSDQEVIDSFVARFGDNVVGVPQDPVLRALTLLMPLLATALAIGAGVFTFRRFGVQPKLSAVKAPTPDDEISDEAYRQRLEDDLRGRR